MNWTFEVVEVEVAGVFVGECLGLGYEIFVIREPASGFVPLVGVPVGVPVGDFLGVPVGVPVGVVVGPELGPTVGKLLG